MRVLDLDLISMRKFKVSFSSFRMRRWSGGVLIATLALVLIIRYSSLTQPRNPSPLTFSSNHTVVDSKAEATKPLKPAKRPHLVNLEGLKDLLLLKNSSGTEASTLLVWDSMRALLSRSDALPETAQGVKEAAIAWKGLIFSIKEDQALVSNDIDRIEAKTCPPSVDSHDKASLNQSHVIGIPCGLILDSSVTVVGIPDRGLRSFQIKLLGPELQGELNPPIVLHYNIRLPGENMTEEPYIVQNTWTNELGWGEEDRCPNHSSVKGRTVDELPLCDEQNVRSAMEQNQNMTRSSNATASNVSYRWYNFPFFGVNPFTATLWVGLEGFHMTVNGRHETSFAYRKKLEPWSVSRVRVSGGLNLLSMVATGLPVPEDHGLDTDAKLKAPSLSGKKLLLLIAVFSTGNNFERRMALRRSWMQYEAVRSGEVAVRFLIGFHKNTQVNFEMWKEAQAYRDIQFMPFVDYYGLISLKTVALCILGTKIIPAKYIMKTDDDAFVRIDELLSSLKGKPSTGLLYGLVSFDSSPNRDEESKWFISQEEWPHDTYPPWAHGPGYIISRDIAKFVVRGHRKRDLRLFKLEDVAMGIWVEQFNKTIHEVQYSSDERFHNIGCKSDYILAHYQGPRLMLCLWEKLQKEHQAICCE